MARDRSYVITEAIDAYLEVNQWQIEHIRKVCANDAGEFASDDEVAAALPSGVDENHVWTLPLRIWTTPMTTLLPQPLCSS